MEDEGKIPSVIFARLESFLGSVVSPAYEHFKKGTFYGIYICPYQKVARLSKANSKSFFFLVFFVMCRRFAFVVFLFCFLFMLSIFACEI